MCSVASGSRFFINKVVEKRTSKCLRCDYEFTFPSDLYKHLWCNKTDCKNGSNVSKEEAKKHANPPDYYKCQFCREIIIDKTERKNHELECDKKDIIDTFSVNNIDPLISYLFAFNEDGLAITNVDKETGYVNATLMCKSVKKELKDYFKTESTKILITELEKYKNNSKKNRVLTTGVDYSQSIIFEKPSILNAKVNHTHVQETIAIDLAGWCNVKYKVIVYNHIINYNKGLIKTENSIQAKQDIENINNEIVKINITSSKNYTNKHSPQFYMRKLINKPSEVELYDSLGNRIIDDIYNIFKGGSQGDHTGRQDSHISQLKGSIHLDSIECFNYTKLEKYTKDIAKELNILCKIKNSGKDLNGTEYYIFKTQEEYDDFIIKIYNKAEELNKDINNNELDIENVKLKQKELELNIEKEKTRQLEIELELKKYGNIPSTSQTIIEPKKTRKGTSKFNGVKKGSRGIMYETSITKDKVRYQLGSYLTPELAAYAYNCKALEIFGDTYMKLNNVNKPINYIWNSKINRLVPI
jgi:KilA-N domain